jgi:hypothetical protein
MLMYYDDAIKEYADIAYKINKHYCDKHGIDIIVSNEKTYADRKPSYEKLPLVLKYIDQYDYLVWIDADAFFYGGSEDIRNIINTYADKEFIFSQDYKNWLHCTIPNVNLGIFIVKSSEYTKQFIKFWAYDEESYNKNPGKGFWEQGVLIKLFNENKFEIQSKIVSLKYGVLQHFREEGELSSPSTNSLVFHLSNKSSEFRQNYFTKYYASLT